MLARIATKASCLFVLIILSFSSKAQLRANFTATPSNGCAALVVRFTDQSTGNPSNWRWDLGNGTISFLQNPSVTYFTPGQYTVKLVVRNGINADSVVRTNYINVYALPVVQFTASQTTGCYPLPVQFSDQSAAGSGTIASWQWDFGDGFSSTIQNPSHIYTASGNYNVTLRIRNSNGCINTLSKTQYINITSGVRANFTNTVPNTCSAPSFITFQSTSIGTGTLTYQWDFGDGGSSSLQNPSHVYNASGSYTVRLIVTNSSGCTDTIVKPNAISLGNVNASFTTADSICVRNPVTITNSSTPIPGSVVWNFGDATTSTQLNPVKTYTTPGTYQIRMIANFGACFDSAFKTVVVKPGPAANFIADDTADCKAPFTVNFSNLSLNSALYQWDFGDGNTSTAQNPSHTYNSTGSFNVKLVVTSSTGCTDTLTKASYINIKRPVIVFNNLPDSGCVPFTKQFVSTVTSSEAVVSYLWDLGDGTTSTNVSPTHTYNSNGVYPISLIITTASGCSDTALLPRGIITNTYPNADFYANPRSACAKETITFTDTSTGNINQWFWDFGDGSTSAAHNPTHIYNDTGFFTIQLVVSNHGCKDTAKFQDYIYIKPPIAKFLVVNNCKKPYEKVFTDQSIGADSWFWDFGDGTTSTTQSPIHTYANQGTYTVTLVVVNDSTGCDFTTTKTIRVIDVKATFFASDTVICKGSSINFTTNLSLQDVRLFSWSFGDGGVANAASNSVSYTYTRTGSYTVRLIITNVLGCKDTLTKSLYINVFGPTAKFASLVPGSCLNSAVILSDSSTTDGSHPIQTWIWDYRDGSNDTLTSGPFAHIFTASGIYPVKLKVTDSYGCSDIYTIPISLIISKPVAKFTSIDTLACPNQDIHFTNQSTGPNLTYLWKFGDGDTSTLQNPVHVFAGDGDYTITLYITDQYGCTDSVRKPNYIKIVTPIAHFSMSDSISTCPPLVVQFTDMSTGVVASRRWDFGDGTSSTTLDPSHFYTYPGTYIVRLIVTARGGCFNYTEKTIIVRGPRGTFTYDPLAGCVPVNINFIAHTQDRLSIIWDFNDGNTFTGTDSTISHTYTYPGAYLPKMILVDSAGCQVPIIGADSIRVTGVLAKFGFINRAICDSGIVAFTDSSYTNDPVSGYHWTFGDGTTSTSHNPVHQYTTPGVYYPQLIVSTQFGCRDTASVLVPIKVIASPQINIISTANGCAPLTTAFNAVLTIPDTSAINWNWDFANGNTSTLQTPSAQDYTTAGIYNVHLTATNSTGCKDSLTRTIEAYAVPVVDAGIDTSICKGRGIILHATGAATYTWSPSTGLNCSNCANPIAMPDSVMNYAVIGSSIHGCTDNDSVIVRVNYPFAMRYGTPATLCKGQSVKLSATGALNYQWSPAAGLSNSDIASPTAQPDSSTNYRVIGSDNAGCFKDTGFVFLKVYPIPTVNAGSDKFLNIGHTMDLVPVISSDVTSVNWSPTGNIFRNDYPGISINPTTNTDYTVEVSNDGGCTARDIVSIFVICDGANVFIPNTFSPNGDGANDLFYARGTGLFKIKRFRVFNRWGELMFDKNDLTPNDASQGWDGTYKGSKLNPDVFVYTIDIMCQNNSLLTYNGNVTLIQ